MTQWVLRTTTIQVGTQSILLSQDEMNARGLVVSVTLENYPDAYQFEKYRQTKSLFVGYSYQKYKGYFHSGRVGIYHESQIIFDSYSGEKAQIIAYMDSMQDGYNESFENLGTALGAVWLGTTDIGNQFIKLPLYVDEIWFDLKPGVVLSVTVAHIPLHSLLGEGTQWGDEVVLPPPPPLEEVQPLECSLSECLVKVENDATDNQLLTLMSNRGFECDLIQQDISYLFGRWAQSGTVLYEYVEAIATENIQWDGFYYSNDLITGDIPAFWGDNYKILAAKHPEDVAKPDPSRDVKSWWLGTGQTTGKTYIVILFIAYGYNFDTMDQNHSDIKDIDGNVIKPIQAPSIIGI